MRRLSFSLKIHNYFIELSYFVLYNIEQSNIKEQRGAIYDYDSGNERTCQKSWPGL